jgi:hypothetical protein
MHIRRSHLSPLEAIAMARQRRHSMTNKTQEREREILLEEVRQWIASRDIAYVCHSPEVTELIHELEREHDAYPQVIVNLDEN